LAQSLNQNDTAVLDLHYINKCLVNLEEVLKNNQIHTKNDFKNWLNDYQYIYGTSQTNIKLYLISALLYFVGLTFISKFIFENDTNPTNDLKRLVEVQRITEQKYQNVKLFEYGYFTPLVTLSEREDLSLFNGLIINLSEYIFNLDIEPVYFFDYMIQKIISPITRHKSGEYYTPPFLVKKMVKESYKFGQTILDPCCGSGNFLIEVIKLIKSQKKSKNEKNIAINNVYGFDINPISIYISKINILYMVKNDFPGININMVVYDSLFHTKQEYDESFDLIIGNPPWYTYRDIESVEYQENIKKLAEALEVKPLPKNILNLEISTLFFVRSVKVFMKDNAKIFFVITKGVITGSHASRFRNFKNLSDIKIWMFNRTIEKVFNIDFICLYGQKSNEKIKSNEEATGYHFKLRIEKSKLDYYENLNLELENVEILIPYSVEKRGRKTYTKKLIPRALKKNLILLKESFYKTLFHKGADLNPRNLIFVNFEEINDGLVKINPDKRIFQRSKAPWDKVVFNDEIIEKNYLFKVVKSTELVKFLNYDYYDVFLPLSISDLSFNYENLASNAHKFYDKINNFYLKHKKETTKHNSLMENLNRWSKLINKRQISKIKVVYNNSGSILCSTVIQGDFLVTGDLTFYDTENLDEAYYLSATLNSSLLTKQIQIVKSSRHIFKLPLDFPIIKFDETSLSHQKLVKLGKKAQKIAEKTAIEISEQNLKFLSKFKFQNILKDKLKTIFIEIDKILLKEFAIHKF